VVHKRTNKTNKQTNNNNKTTIKSTKTQVPHSSLNHKPCVAAAAGAVGADLDSTGKSQNIPVSSVRGLTGAGFAAAAGGAGAAAFAVVTGAFAPAVACLEAVVGVWVDGTMGTAATGVADTPQAFSIYINFFKKKQIKSQQRQKQSENPTRIISKQQQQQKKTHWTAPLTLQSHWSEWK
jgi:hypothetical protein